MAALNPNNSPGILDRTWGKSEEEQVINMEAPSGKGKLCFYYNM
jgi:hypothetical protein